MNLQEAIQNLTGATARLEALTAERNTAQEALTVAQARIVELETQVASAPVDQSAEVTRLAGELSTATARVTELEATQADFDGRVTAAANAEAARIIAGNGHQGPVNTVLKNDNPAAKTITKAEFDAMSHSQRNEHFRNGGKISN